MIEKKIFWNEMYIETITLFIYSQYSKPDGFNTISNTV